jgi:hypothetical protein
MKQLNIQWNAEPAPAKPHAKNKNYCVYLGFGKREYFSSKREAQNFVNKTNQFLTYKMLELNICYADTFATYRRSWPYFAHNKTRQQQNLRLMEIKCREQLQDVSRMFDLMFSTHENIASSIAKFFYTIQEFLENVLTEIKKLYRSRSMGAQVAEAEFIIQRMNRITQQIENWNREMKQTHTEKTDYSFLKIVG